MGRDLDDVDRSVLYLLQQDARNISAAEIADRVGVSASTVRNRINQLETDGIIRGYHPEIDYEAANFSFRMTFVISSPPTALSDLAEEIRNIRGVIDTRELLTGQRNIHADVVGTGTNDVIRISDAIHALGAEIVSTDVLRRRHVQPFDHFFLQGTEELEARTDVFEADEETSG